MDPLDDLFPRKSIKDNVHGYVEIPCAFYRYFIDTPIFQRLRYIEQTGMRILYPSARHDRFIHSIGTCYLGMKAYESLYNNSNSAGFLDKCGESKAFWDKYYLLFSIACLLHDCGHSPFSHSLEFIYSLEPDLTGEFTTKLDKELADSNRTPGFIASVISGKAKEHEKMSAIVVKKQYDEQIKKCITEIIEGKEKAVLETESSTVTDIDASQKEAVLNDDVEFVMRSILGYPYIEESENVQNQIKNCLISLLNSKNFDVDSLDYIVRDSQMAGLQNYSIDIERVLNSLRFSRITRFRDVTVKDMRVLDTTCRLKLSQVKDITGQLSGQFSAKKYKCSLIGCLDINCHNTSCTRTTPLESGSVRTTNAQIDREIPSGHYDDIEIFGVIRNKCELSGDQIESRTNFCGKMRKMEADTVEINAKQLNATISGRIIEGEILSTDMDYSSKSARGIQTYILSFDKSALSVLQNIINARNYEYTTIYGHHKVAYYANYLIQEILKRAAKIGLESETSDKALTEILNYDSLSSIIEKKCWTFSLITDSDLLYFIKQIQHKVKSIESSHDKDQSQLLFLADELLTRKYRKSVWKSFAEFNAMFFCLSDSQKNDLVSIFKTEMTDIIQGQGLYGYLKPEYAKTFMELGMSDVVWVTGDVPLKNPNPDSIYIQINSKTSRLSDVLPATSSREKQALTITYLYYTDNDIPFNARAFIEYCKDLVNTKRGKPEPSARRHRATPVYSV